MAESRKKAHREQFASAARKKNERKKERKKQASERVSGGASPSTKPVPDQVAILNRDDTENHVTKTKTVFHFYSLIELLLLESKFTIFCSLPSCFYDHSICIRTNI